MNEVFAKELSNMDAGSKEVLEKIVSYMEKKYISVPMKMAKDILIEDAKTK
jgi:glutamyl-tRNA reductase